MRQQAQNSAVVLLLLTTAWLGAPLAVSSQDKSTEIPSPAGRVIQPADVYVLTLMLRQELDTLAFEMGEARETRPEIRVAGVQPREVYFQALTLFQKSSQLCFEFTQQGHVPPPRLPTGIIRPGHVWNIVQAALEHIACVNEALHMPQHRGLPPRDETKTPTDVFKSIVQANRQLNILLEREFSPTDVYGQVQLATAYGAELLSMLRRFDDPSAASQPKLPPYERGQRPEHVYQRLSSCIALIERIAQASGLPVLEFAPDPTPLVAPSDVYDIAALVVSELYYFSTLLGSKLPESPQRNQRKLPSHVFQQVGLLQAQLTAIEDLVQRYPNWHTMHD